MVGLAGIIIFILGCEFYLVRIVSYSSLLSIDELFYECSYAIEMSASSSIGCFGAM